LVSTGIEFSSIELGGVVRPELSSVSDVDADSSARSAIALAIELTRVVRALFMAEGTAEATAEGTTELAAVVTAVGGAVPRGGRSCTMERWVKEGVSGQ
jgi:hypothetical protein